MKYVFTNALLFSLILTPSLFSLTKDVEVDPTERNQTAAQLESECLPRFFDAVDKGENTIQNMKKPTLGLVSDSLRRKIHYENKHIHIRALQDMAEQAKLWINGNKTLIQNEIKRQYFDIAKTKYVRECQQQIDNLNDFVKWTIEGNKNPPQLFIDNVKKAAKGQYSGDVE